MNHNQHKQFVDDLVKLADEEGKTNSGARLREFGKLLKASRGDLEKFVEMVKVGKKVILKRAAIEAGKSLKAARKLGQEFGRAKIADV